MSLIDPEQHAELINRQRDANAAWHALDHHAPGVSGSALTEAQRTEAAALRQQACNAAQELRDALHASGLVREHGYYQPSQDLMVAARATVTDT